MILQLSQKRILSIARLSIQFFLKKQEFLMPDEWKDDTSLYEKRASFVTLEENNFLRGCIGSIIPRQPLWKDVSENAVNAAFYDPRFEPLTEEELADLSIEVSVLTKPVQVKYLSFQELEGHIRPLIDGVIIQAGHHQATFLPQVWKELSDPTLFFKHLCLKADLPGDFFRNRYNELSIYTYQVEIINEKLVD